MARISEEILEKMQKEIEADIARCEQLIELTLQIWPGHPPATEALIREAHVLLGVLRHKRAEGIYAQSLPELKF
jgi:hypothetical protein